ncbi:MAG: amidohydrolase/deacetylase family metallohydrolase [Saprospiraceae bacterium]|nr:amidohydrolase/deacetylase family metallohydrolase [Saprospiraceae bacterium]
MTSLTKNLPALGHGLCSHTAILSLFLVLLVFPIGKLSAQAYDLLLRGGNLIDPKNEINAKMDVAIKDGKIAAVEASIPTASAKQVIDVQGLTVVPGLIDMHGHHFWGTRPDAYLSNSYASLPPDGFSLPAGVTTVVDAGCAGWRNFKIFKTQTIDRSRTRVLAFINIIGGGMAGGAIEQNLGDMDPKLTAMEARRFADHIVGVKLAHYSGEDWTPTERAVEAGRQAGIPVMIDFGRQNKHLNLEVLFMEKLRPGDIFTHCFADVRGRMPIVDDEGKLRSFIKPAQQRGIIFDIGHGGGSFVYSQAIPAIEQGFYPNSISTDLHTGSMNGGMKSMSNLMSKLMNIGLTLEQVIEQSTWNPAQIIQREDLGHLSVGAVADITVLQVATGQFGFTDTAGSKIIGDKKLIAELTIREGKVLWDLNGISRPLYKH